MQEEVLHIFSEVCGVPEDQIPIGIDGCSVPVHAIPIKNMAMGFARESNPEYLPEIYQKGARELFAAMNAHPEMVAGTNGFCTELIQNTHGKLIGKLGAEAVYCVEIKDRNIGIAIKMEDGIYRGLWPTVMAVLEQLDVLTEEEKESLKSWAHPEVHNIPGTVVGEIRPTFKLHFVK